jgi:signal transduction histidine kinase
MGYDILTKVIELTDSEDSLEKRFTGIARLLLTSFAFDQCAIYLFNQERNFLNSIVTVGGKWQKEYREDEGFPGLVIKKGRPVFIGRSEPAKGLLQKVTDRGVDGFATIVCCPVRDSVTYGVLYLKSRKRKTISPQQKKLFAVIALQLATAIKNYGCINNLKDVNTRMQDMQARLVHAEKLLALGEMAATLAHEIKNPLMSIGGFARRLRQQITLDPSQVIYVERIVKEVQRLEKLMDGIVRFSRNSGYELSSEDMNKIVEEVVQLFEEDCKRNRIDVIKNLSPNIPMIEIDRQQVKLAFNNLMANAIQAMGDGGTLTIKTMRRDNWIVTEFGDTGGGIAHEIMGNIFNPFFTTKETGTGLGLAITHSIIANHKGIIEVNNNSGVGVTFIIKLPVGDTRQAIKRIARGVL